MAPSLQNWIEELIQNTGEKLKLARTKKGKAPLSIEAHEAYLKTVRNLIASVFVVIPNASNDSIGYKKMIEAHLESFFNKDDNDSKSEDESKNGPKMRQMMLPKSM